MWTWLRRMLWLSLVCGAGYAAYTAWQRKNEPVAGGPPEWPPLSATNPTNDPPAADGPPEGGWSTDTPVSTGEARRWAEPVDGACPEGYPIKANANSGIYHVPGGRFYSRTVPERCYSDEASAEADGYRRAKA